NAKIAVATRPGAQSGNTTRMNAPARVQPSIIAASSSSTGMLATNPRSVQTMNGTMNARYVTITLISVSIAPKLSISRKTGMTSADSGTIWTTRIRIRNARRPRKPKRATPTAAANARARETATTVSTTIRLVRTLVQKNGRETASAKLASVNGAGTSLGSKLRMSRPGLNAVATIQ